MNNLAKGNLKGLLAIGMLVLAGFIIIFTFQLRGGGLILPSLISVFGVKFGLIFTVFQIGYCYYFCEKKAFWWMTGGLLLGFVGGYLNVTKILFPIGPLPPYSLGRAVLMMGGCVSAIVIAIGVLKGKL